jgi:LysR family positive regulator for ilvC
MDTKALKIFTDLATDLHFGRTSERNNMSASTLSRLVQRVEAEVGAALLERDNRHVALTSAGQRYLVFARETLSAWQALQEDIGLDNSQPSGTVSLYCSVTASHSVLTRILADLRQQQPQIEIKLHTGDQALSLARLKQGREDFVIAAKPEQLQPQIAFKSLSVSDLVLIGPTGACAVRQQLDEMQRSGSFDWSALPWVVAERGITRSKLDRWFRQRSVSPNIYAQVSGHEAIASMVALGCGVGLVPKLVLTSSPVFDSIQVLDGAEANPNAVDNSVTQTIDIGLCVLKRRINEPLINAVWLGVK